MPDIQIDAQKAERNQRRISDGLLTPLLIVFVLPAYQIWHIAKFANTRSHAARQNREVHRLRAADRRLERDLGSSGW
jgi:hypothetical protein